MQGKYWHLGHQRRKFQNRRNDKNYRFTFPAIHQQEKTRQDFLARKSKWKATVQDKFWSRFLNRK